nr:TetR/AcrR family transcriptional regulator [Bacillus pacificus]
HTWEQGHVGNVAKKTVEELV